MKISLLSVINQKKIFNKEQNRDKNDFISMLLELESKDVNNKIDNEQYNSSSTKLLMKKLTPNVK